jgi:AcrR family transcriptional regulator
VAQTRSRRAGPVLLPGEVAPPVTRTVRSARSSQIVATARTVVEEEGIGALTMRRLAVELGIRAPSLYKHFDGKGAVEHALVEDALWEVGEVTHRALHRRGTRSPTANLLAVYRRYSLAHGHLYRLATSGTLDRHWLTPGLEEWAGNPWFVVTAQAELAQALWSFAHGMVILELDDRYPPQSDLDGAWRAGASAFEGPAYTTTRSQRAGLHAG